MRYFIGLLVTLGLLIILMVLLISGGHKKSGTVSHPKSLVDYATTDAQVSMTIDGPVNADSEHVQVVVTVDSSQVTYEQIQGYQGHVVNTKAFTNNEDAYNVFLNSLYRAGFSLGDNNPALRNYNGVCSTGDRYIFELTQDGNTLEKYWNTSCGYTKTYLGNTNLTLTLFKAQVPNYDTLTENLQL